MLILKYLKLPYLFDVIRLQQELSLFRADLWQNHYQTKHYEGGWSALPLRSTDGKRDNVIISPLEHSEYKDTLYLNQCPYIREVLATFKCPLQAVRLLKLNARAIIKEHKDAELFYEKGEIRLHIPIVTNDEVEFYSDKERLYLKEGECWYVNFNLPHHINNNSDRDRVHLVIDAVVNDWVKALFDHVDPAARKEVEEYDTDTKREMIARFREMNTDATNKMADELEKEITASHD